MLTLYAENNYVNSGGGAAGRKVTGYKSGASAKTSGNLGRNSREKQLQKAKRQTSNTSNLLRNQRNRGV